MVMLVLSPDALSSSWVQHEYQIASEAQRQIGPIIVRETALPGFLQTLSPINAIGQNPIPVAQMVAERLGVAPSQAVPSAAPSPMGPTLSSMSAPSGAPAYTPGARSDPVGAEAMRPDPEYAMARSGPEAPRRDDRSDNRGYVPPSVQDLLRKPPPQAPASANEPRTNTSAIVGGMIAVVLLILVAVFFVKPLLGGKGSPSTAGTTGTPTVPVSAPTAITVKLNAGQFVNVTSVTLKQGGSLTITDLPEGVLHPLVTGQNSIYTADPQAPQELNTANGYAMQPNMSHAFVFANTGTFHITCLIHPGMNLAVVVVP